MTEHEIQQLRNDGHDEAADEIVRLREHAVILANTERLVERERCASVVRYWLAGHAPAARTYEAQCLEHVLDGRPAPTGWTERA